MKTILFDLDGTLLPMNLEKFMKLYIDALTEKFKPYLEPSLFKKNLWTATRAMISNSGRTKSNEKVFMETFTKDLSIESEKAWLLFDHFYSNEFSLVKKSTWQNPNMIESVRLLKEKQYPLVIATNPLFPQNAVCERIRWAGLNPEDFLYMTTFEKMHAAKPNTEYYEEILDHLKLSSEEVLMVGNDALEDLAAAEVGISTYLLTDHLLNRDKQKNMPDLESNTDDFLEFVKTL
ncbi:HAD family hydrolase [Tindallia californiensis]|uniref:FMN phosphatase YigB, HAD superfamily n=1 Tax=Tindallia californiensis TaxID=159292 RepID=A0A1H3ID56_9FIRM|nr:HAD family hydrolase [Tindallia californiensis]SDY25670.1 FMN phosphatase YigB, HAD superfamily [Tindallia californiensis]